MRDRVPEWRFMRCDGTGDIWWRNHRVTYGMSIDILWGQSIFGMSGQEWLIRQWWSHMPLVPSHIPRQLSDMDNYAHTLTHAQSTGGKWHWLNAKILPQSHFDQATVPADMRGRKTDRSARGELEAAANERRCVDANTTPTTALNSHASLQGGSRRRCRASLQGGSRRRCRASLQGGGPLAVTTSEGDRCGLGAVDNCVWSLFSSVGTNNHKLCEHGKIK